MRLRRKPNLWIIIVIGGIMLCLGMPTVLISEQLRQDALDHALIQAVKRLDAPAVARLLDQGANANARDTGEPPLTIPLLLKRLLEPWQHKRNFVAAEAGDTALYLLLSCSLTVKASPRFDPIAVALIQHGADIHFKLRSDYQSTPLHVAARGMPQTTRLLLNRGANVNARDELDNTPLMCADEEATMLLLQHGADVNAKGDRGCTALLYAAEVDKVKMVKILLEHGANVNATDDKGHSVLFWMKMLAEKHVVGPNQAKIICLLKHHGAHMNRTDEDRLKQEHSPL